MANALPPVVQGLQAGFGMGEGLLNDLMKRRQSRQQMALAKQRAGQQAELFPLQKQLKQAQLQKAKMAVDPQAQLKYIQQLMQGFGGDQQPTSAEDMPSFIPSIGDGQSQQPDQVLQLAQGAVSEFDAQQSPDMRQMMQNPMLRGFFKQQFGFDPATRAAETPEQREQREVRTAEEKEQKKLDVKQRTALREELPKARELIQRIEGAIPLIGANRDLFGPGVGGLDFLGGPKQRYRRLRDPKKIAAFKKLSNLFAELQGKQASDFSSRSMKVAFDLAKEAKASMEDHPEAAQQTLQDILQKMKTHLHEDMQRFQEAGGKMPSSGQRLKYNPVTGRLE